MENGTIPAFHINEHHQFVCTYVTSRVNQDACLKHSLIFHTNNGRPFSFQFMIGNHPRKRKKTVGTWKNGNPPLEVEILLGTQQSFRFQTLRFRAFLHPFGEFISVNPPASLTPSAPHLAHFTSLQVVFLHPSETYATVKWNYFPTSGWK